MEGLFKDNRNIDKNNKLDSLSKNSELKKQVDSAENTDEVLKKEGGSYKDLPNIEGKEKHHMPADSTTEIPYHDGPCILMKADDHKKTASWGNSKDAQEYRAKQKELIEQGKFDEALQMDIDDIHDKFGDKYDEGIAELKEYHNDLKEEGKVS